EYQKRGAVHLHAIVRLDGVSPDGAVVAPPAEMTTEFLAQGLRAARAAAVVSCPELAVLGRADTAIRWGTELDVRPMTGAAGEPTAELVALYVAKYAVKSSESLGLPNGRIDEDADIERLAVPSHVRSLVRACWVLGARHEFAGLKLQDNAMKLGFGGHFLTKSRAYSTTFGALEEVRRNYARRRHNADGDEGPDAWDPPDDEDQGRRVAEWHYLGWGYHTIGEAYLASSAAAQARAMRKVAWEEMTSWVA
ncbi:MAG: replication initiator, partial [Actinomycetota bacterium]